MARKSPSPAAETMTPAADAAEVALNIWLDAQRDLLGAQLEQFALTQQAMFKAWFGLLDDLSRPWQGPWAATPAWRLEGWTPWAPWAPFFERGAEQLG